MQYDQVTPSSFIRRNSGLAFSAIDGEVVMMSVDQGKYYGLNTVGSRIWELLEAPRTMGELCRALEETFEVGTDQCREEVARFLDRIAVEKLIDISSAPASET